jgi:radical SAM protein with 4Fe4S-binding SPASM domain
MSIFALGTNLEVFSCQSLIDKPPLGYFDENIKHLLATSEANQYFYNRTLLPQCTDCGVLNWCRGGCRAVHLTDKKAVDITCKIKQEIIPFILREIQGYSNRNYGNFNYNRQHENNDLNKYINDYVKNLPKENIKLVETPDLPKD